VTASTAQEQPRPNILLIISDDIGLDVTTTMYPGLIDRLVEQYGPSGLKHPDYTQISGRPASTPNLDALARQGVSFTNAWVQPFCSPTRASILTGLFAAKTHVLDYTHYVTHSHHSFVNDLKTKGGYSTAVFGKWHMAGLGQYPGMRPKEAGFDLFLGNLHGGLATYWDYDYHVQDETTPPDQWRTEKPPARSLPGIAPTTYAPVVKVADTLAWIRKQEAADPARPWFAWLAFNVAHITGNQQPNPMAVPNADTMNEVARREMEACQGTFGSANVGSCSSEALMRAMTNSMDTVIGKLLDGVDAIDRNTYVIYIGDNGSWMFGARREFIDNMYITRQDRGKGTAYESGARVPFTIRGPRIAASTRSDEPVHGVDLFPTILKLAGLDAPTTVPNTLGTGTVAVDGVSLAPILFDGARSVRDPVRDYLLTETVNPIKNNRREAGARNGTYKVLCAERATADACAFYHLVRDPLEEFPLDEPESCASYETGRWTPTDQAWHFCRLLGVLATDSFLSSTWVMGPNISPAGGRGAGRRGGGPGPAGGRGAGPRGRGPAPAGSPQ
jgi:arylsulfatase A-like enzyme